VLAAFDRLEGDGAFTREDEQLLEAFAAQAATAVAMAKSVEADHRRRALAAAEAERHRWARELHDACAPPCARRLSVLAGPQAGTVVRARLPLG
jgi:GAF domain-containing protein